MEQKVIIDGSFGEGGNIVAWAVSEPATITLIGLRLPGIFSRVRRKK